MFARPIARRNFGLVSISTQALRGASYNLNSTTASGSSISKPFVRNISQQLNTASQKTNYSSSAAENSGICFGRMVSNTLDQAKDAGEIVIEDDNIWLEGVTDEKALDWVKSVNEKSLQGDADIGLKALKDPTNGGDKALYDRILSILESKEKIPSVRKREQSFTDGKNFFNYWQDDQHVRGIWRRTSWEEYQKKEPDWEV